jgi:indole-3-glycerol phosphate synthase
MILDVIVEDKLKRLPEHKKRISEEKMKELALSSTRKINSFYEAIKKDGLSVIGEFKKASPSHGIMNNKIDLVERIRQYSESADAISCLTEEDHFNGSTEYLRQIRNMTQLPIIRKDFIIDPYQVYEARVIGADAILLIAAILDDDKFKELYELAYSLGLDVLCEVHDEEEMKRMLALDVKIIGINNRNLKTFEVNLETTKKLSDMVTDDMRKAGKLLVSESGVSDTDDIKLLAKSRADALLIGTVLMEAENPCELISEFKCIYDNECEKEELDENGKKTEVKICGITSEADARLLIKYGADYGGMVVFYPKSKRDITIDEAGRLVKILKESDIKTVAVTVSPDTDKLRKIQDNGFDYIQIHGELYEDVYNESRIPIIRAVNIGKNDNMDDIKKSISEAAHKEKIVGILLDAGIPGSGKTFDWNSVKELELKEKKLFLAGGLNSLNVAAAVKCAMPDVVDISTGVEYDDILIKGKDEKKVKEFILNARK